MSKFWFSGLAPRHWRPRRPIGFAGAPAPIFVFVVALALTASCILLHAQESDKTTPSAKGSTEAHPATPPEILQPGTTLDETVETGSEKRFQVSLAAGQYAEIELNVSVVMGLSGHLQPPEGGQELEANTGFGSFVVPLLASKGGTFLFTVRRINKLGGEGAFQVSLSPPRPARADDETRVAATHAFGEGEKLYSDRSAAASREKLVQFQKALGLWEQLGDKRQEALSLMRIGQVYGYLYENSLAVEYLLRARSASQDTGFAPAEAAICMSLGMVYQVQGEKQRALESLHQALDVSRKIHHKYAEAIALMALGASDDSVDALDYLQQALVLFREVGERSGEAYILNQLGQSYLSRGRQQEALEDLRQGLEIARAGSDSTEEANILRNLGSAYAMQADLRQALDFYSQALPLAHAQGELAAEHATLLQISTMYLSLGELDEALEYSRQALLGVEKVESPGLEAAMLVQMGRVFSELGNQDAALLYFRRAFLVFRRMSDPLSQADALTGIGDSYFKQKKFQLALNNYQQALALFRTAPHLEVLHLGVFHGEADILRSIGAAEVSLKQTKEALGSLNHALEVLPTSAHTTEDEAAILYELARAERDSGHLPEALARINAALDLTERLRSTVAGADLRASYLAKVRDRYELLIGLLMQLHLQHPEQGYDARALEASERARSRGLLDLLSESQVDIREGVDPALLAREHSLQQQLSFKAAYRLQMLAKSHTEQQTAEVEKEIGDLTSAYEETQAQIRALSPHYAGITQPQPLTVPEIQRLLDADTVLLEYSLGSDESFLWIVTADGLKSQVLPKRAAIDALARRAYEEMSTNNPAGGRQATIALGRMLLGPAAYLSARERLAVVAEGTLEYISFAALQLSAQAGPMVARHEIVSLPSASTLSLLRKELAGRALAPRQVAVLADPVFSASDPRVTGEKISSPSRPLPPGGGELERSPRSDSSQKVQHSAKEAGLLILDRLPASRREAQTIVALAGQDRSLEALDFDASLQTATSPVLGQYRIVHFASHTLLNSTHPELSGIVLSMVDAQGHPEDGFLQAHQIFNLKLNADMVVLSACRTALGKEVRGEGLVGLTRAFMYAGAPRVVASLWRVPDGATAELMRRFYQALFTEGLSPAAALRQSQLALAQDKRWSAPYYWAGFALLGEWK